MLCLFISHNNSFRPVPATLPVHLPQQSSIQCRFIFSKLPSSAYSSSRATNPTTDPAPPRRRRPSPVSLQPPSPRPPRSSATSTCTHPRPPPHQPQRLSPRLPLSWPPSPHLRHPSSRRSWPSSPPCCRSTTPPGPTTTRTTTRTSSGGPRRPSCARSSSGRRLPNAAPQLLLPIKRD